MFKANLLLYSVWTGTFLSVLCAVIWLRTLATAKSEVILSRIRGMDIIYDEQNREDVLARPFLERTLGSLSRWLVNVIGKITPDKVSSLIHDKLENAGNPYNLKTGEFITFTCLIGFTAIVLSIFGQSYFQISPGTALLPSMGLTAIAVYLPWFALAVAGTKRQREIRRSLPEISDLLVISVEAGLGFDLALLKVIEKFKGPIADEFLQAYREMQLGKQRRDALKDMADKINVPELTSLVNSIIQSDQLGVGISNTLRMQSELIREKRRQYIEELAMKAPVKMLFPMVFFIFPSMFIVILGPAVLSIVKVIR